MKILRKERFYKVPPEVVWEALTNPAALAEWLMPNNFRPELGATFEFVTDPTPICGSGITKCKVIELEPNRRMSWSWLRDAGPGHPGHAPMTITWTLSHESEGTRLVLEQRGLEGQGWLIGFLMSTGWGMMLKRTLTVVVAGIAVEDGLPRFRPGIIPLSKRYYKSKTVPKSHLY